MKFPIFVTTLLAVTGVSLVTFTEPSHASLRICNKTRSSISVAIGYPEGNVWTSRGWFNIAPGDCQTPISGSLTNRYYYLYGNSADDRSWKGNHYFCTESSRFTISGDENCEDRGYRNTGFQQIDTGSSRDYTLNLTSDDSNPDPSPDEGEVISRTRRREFGGVRDCGNSSRQRQEANAVCSAIQENLVASGYTILHRYDPEILDSDSNVWRFCTDPTPLGCVGYGNKCSGWVNVRCRFQVR